MYMKSFKTSGPGFVLSAEVCPRNSSLLRIILNWGRKNFYNIGPRAWVFNSQIGRMHAVHLHFYESKHFRLKLKIWPKQLLGYLPVGIVISLSSVSQILMEKKYCFAKMC